MKNSALSKLGQRSEDPAISWLMAVALSRPKLISLAAGFTDNESLPVRGARETLDEILRSKEKGQPALQYGTTQGDPVLRKLTAKDLQVADGASGAGKTYSPERMILTNGSQQMLYMTTEALCDAGDIVLLEDPTYFVYTSILQSHGIRARGIPLEQDGINLAKLEQTLKSLKKSGEIKRVKMLYLVTYFQNPTGVTTSFKKKLAALKLLRKYERAAGHPIYLLEDAAYRGLRFTGDDERSALTAKGFSDRVIYAGTYSKPFATGTRVGFGISPAELHAVIMRIKGNHDFGSSNLLQQLVAHAISSGKYEEHVAHLQKRYAHKARVMLRAIKEHFPPQVEWWQAKGGLYFWARLPKNIQTGTKSKIFAAALENGVFYVPGELCYADDPTRRKPNHEMRLSFGGATEKNISSGIARLGEVLKRFLKK